MTITFEQIFSTAELRKMTYIIQISLIFSLFVINSL